MPNSERGSDSSHRGHRFNSISLISASNVTFVSPPIDHENMNFENKKPLRQKAKAA
jgi:hypothetical protein